MRATRNLKIWFVLIDNLEEGPYSLNDLKKDLRLTPYTLVRKAGGKKWQAIGKVKELKAVFEDEKRPEQPETNRPLIRGYNEAALLTNTDPDGPVTILVFIILLLVVWVVYNILF